MKKAFLYLPSLAVAALMLAACAGARTVSLACPDTGTLPEADRAVFLSGDTIVAEARLQNLRGHCKIRNDGTTEVTLHFDLAARRGAGGAELTQQDLTYFVAALGAEDTLGPRVQDTVAVTLDRTTGAGLATQEYRITLPPAPDGAATPWRVVLGFNLTPEQLAYNRAGHNRAGEGGR